MEDVGRKRVWIFSRDLGSFSDMYELLLENYSNRFVLLIYLFEYRIDLMVVSTTIYIILII